MAALRFLFLFLIAFPAVRGAAAALPADVSGEAWFSHCERLSAERMTKYPDVTKHKITYAWRSELGYRWEWENGHHAADADDICVRVALYGKRGRFIENVTFLCSVNDRGKRTEVWTFGNFEVAKKLCPLGVDELVHMDERGRNP